MRVIKSTKFNQWYRKLDLTQKVVVDVRITRILFDSHLGVVKRIDNILELKFKSGIRIYYALVADSLILLLNGGGKNTKKRQSRDINQAKDIFQEYLNGK